MKTIQIAHSAVTAQVVTEDRQAKLEIQSILSYMVAGHEHMQGFKSGGWDGKSSFFEFASGKFPRGFVTLVQKHLINKGYQVQIIKKPFPEPLGPERPVIDAFGYTERYDYQPQVMDRLVRHGQIIAQVATGGGKSRIARMCTKRIGRKTLFLTTRGVLMYQMADAFREIEPRVAILGDGKIENGEITCGMVQTISSWLEKTSPENEMNKILEALYKKEQKQIEELKSLLIAEQKAFPEINAAIAKLQKRLESERPSDAEIVAIAKKKATHQEQRRLAMEKHLLQFEFVILEEAHEISGNSFFEIMRLCKNAHYRLALTATPFMKDDEEANMRLMASSGPIAIRISEQMLIERGILAKPYFKFVPLAAHRPPKLFKSTPWQKAYEEGIVKNEWRNKVTVAECMRAARYGLSSMVLIQHKSHGKLLEKQMNDAGVRAEFIFGEDNQAERKAALGRLARGEIDTLIGSTILDVGVDVPAIGLVVLGGGGKAEVALRQRIGRGLREKKGKLPNGDKMPNVAFIVDFADDHNNHLRGHYKQRRGIIEGTPGFAENIVTDFDYTGLGFARKAA